MPPRTHENSVPATGVAFLKVQLYRRIAYLLRGTLDRFKLACDAQQQ